jgi:hypothetical protein
LDESSSGQNPELSPEETDELNRWIKSGKTEQRKVERAKIVLRSAEGKPTHQIAKELGTRPTRVSKWRNRFAQLRLPGLENEPRSGRKVINDESVERRILDQLAKAPPPGFARWNGRLVAPRHRTELAAPNSLSSPRELPSPVLSATLRNPLFLFWPSPAR